MSTDGGLQRQFFEMLMDSQWWSADQLRNYQRSQLSQLLRHAKKNVPFYEHRLDAVVKPNGDIDWDRWSEIPIVRRKDIVEHGDAMIAREFPEAHGGTTLASTSGTSGAPITLTSTQLAHVALDGNRYRSYRWHDVDWTRDCCSVYGDDPGVAAWPQGQRLGPWGPEWDVDALDGTLVRINRVTPYEHILEFIDRIRPAYLTTGPHTGLALALTARRLGRQVRLDAFLPHGAGVDGQVRETVREVLGARSIDLYSTKEAGHIAHACPEGMAMHVNAESLLVEIVDAEGRLVPAGRQGRVVLTTFFNAAQPLIRYDQGDLASWAAPCACGRHLPSLATLVGRSSALFHHPDGRVRSPFMGRHRALLGCEVMQVAQTGPTQFEVRYVPIVADTAGDEAAFAAQMRALLFEDAQVSFRRVSAIPLGASGKLREYVSEWEPGQ